MDITQLEKKILKAIDVERNILEGEVCLEELDTHTTLDTLDHSFIDLKKYIKKCFKEHNQENQKFIDALYEIENRKEEK